MTDLSTDGGLTASRFNLHPFPPAMPSQCSVCGKANVPVVSWGLRVERFGLVMLCVECTSSAGNAVGMKTHEQVQLIIDSYENVITTLTRERDQMAKQIEDQNIGQDLDTRVKHAVSAALTSPDVLAALKEHLGTPEKSEDKPAAAPDDDFPIFSIT